MNAIDVMKSFIEDTKKNFSYLENEFNFIRSDSIIRSLVEIIYSNEKFIIKIGFDLRDEILSITIENEKKNKIQLINLVRLYESKDTSELLFPKHWEYKSALKYNAKYLKKYSDFIFIETVNQ